MFDKLASDIISRYYEKLAWLANKYNFAHGTSANFSPTSRPDRKPDFTSKSNSEYWNTPMGVIRGSDHWGTVGSCDWKLGKKTHPGKKVYGFSPWENFEKKNKSMKKTATFTTRDTIPLQYLKNLSPGKFKNLVNSLPSDHIYRVTGEGTQRFGQESFVNAAIGSKKNGFSDIVNNELPFNAFVKTPKSDKINWSDKLNIFSNPDNSNILAPTFIGLDSDSSAIIQKAMNQNADAETLKRLVQNLNAKIKRKALKIDPANQFKKYTDWVNQVTSTNYHNRAHTPVVKGADDSNYLLSDIYTNTNPNIPPFGGRNTGNMGVDPDTNKLLIFDPRVTKLTPDNLADLDSAMLKTSSALSDVDVSNWDNLSTEERNAIIKLMKPHTFAQLPGDRLGYGYEGSAYRGISPDFGEVTDDAPFNAIIKKFYGFEGEKPRFQARYDIAYNDPEVGKDPEFDKFLQRKFEKPEIKSLIEAGEMAKAEKLLRKMESGTWRHGTRKYNILANPKNNAIMARVLKDAFQPSYETYIDGSHPKVKQIGGLVMERLDIPDMGSLDEGEFKMLNQELANRIDTMHLGSDKGYGTKELDDRHEHANGEIGRSMVFRPMLKDRHGKKWIITDAHNAFTKEEANGMHNYWMHNMGMDNEGKLKIYDFMERKVK